MFKHSVTDMVGNAGKINMQVIIIHPSFYTSLTHLM
ncbi:hypothetical protein SAMN05192573_105253 [Mucilaginibacter gossypii]|uniref:Uncharacterized protein n=1 Tax=Mucilaginibacter gossypii TaxID=551996 RepID=A0A1G7Y3X8_9SPHI|nr:hypothetical protein SAMN05192573_105253 [Mucilaginibacter gossypii]